MFLIRLAVVSPVKKTYFTFEYERVFNGRYPTAFILILTKVEMNANPLGDFSPKVQEAVSATTLPHRYLKTLLDHFIEQSKECNEVAFPRAVRADKHIQRMKFQVCLLNGLEAFD